MTKIDEFYNQLPRGRCHPCEYAKCVVANGQYVFLGCYHDPYNGKSVSEIKNCPKPSAETEQTDCEYCHEDCDGYVTPLEKNCHAIVRCSPMDGWVLSIKYGAWRKDIQINYCPMCGRRLNYG